MYTVYLTLFKRPSLLTRSVLNNCSQRRVFTIVGTEPTLAAVMSNIASIVVLCVYIFQSLMIFVGNVFTVFVFWIHRHKLKRTSFLLINLAVADLLVGFTETLAGGTFALPREIGVLHVNKTDNENTFVVFQTAFSGTSVFFLVLISLERAFALIWPLRHRVTSTKAYIYSIVIVWIAGNTVGALSFLVLYRIFHLRYYVVVYSVIIVLSLITICVSYLAIRTRLNNRVPAVNKVHNRHFVEQNTKLSKTLFIVIAASVAFWVPSLVIYCIYSLSPEFFPEFVNYILAMFRLNNSLVNPIIYSLRIPVFRETLKRLKNKLRIPKQSKRYRVNEGY